MKKELKRLLQEFIERDFEVREMMNVLEEIEDVQLENKMINIYIKRDDPVMVAHHMRELAVATKEAREVMASYGMDYDFNELV